MKKSIAIIGAGAAGYFAAITAARMHPTAVVTLYEATNKPLAKVLISGGGRCNVTNNTPAVTELITQYPRGSKELRSAFSRFAVADTIAWFASEGISLKTEPDNRMFPTTDSSETIAHCLQQAARSAGVVLCRGHKVQRIENPSLNQFTISFSDSTTAEATSLILTTGGSRQGFTLAQQLGHRIVDPVPSLFTFKIEDHLLSDLAGVSFPDVPLHLQVADTSFSWQGPVLITHWGLSGPAVIKLSALAARELHAAAYQAVLRIGFPGSNRTDTVLHQLQTTRDTQGKKKLYTLSLLDLPKRFWQRAVELADIPATHNVADCSKQQFQKLAQLLTTHPLAVTGKGQFKEEFVTCGGVSLSEVDFKTMQSKLVPGLFFAGEILDIDGITGGFNFQSAWTTGWIAGTCS